MKYIDTNVILRFLTDKSRNEKLIDFFKKIESGKELIWCFFK